jgi:hypothetical protein
MLAIFKVSLEIASGKRYPQGFQKVIEMEMKLLRKRSKMKSTIKIHPNNHLKELNNSMINKIFRRNIILS